MKVFWSHIFISGKGTALLIPFEFGICWFHLSVCVLYFSILYLWIFVFDILSCDALWWLIGFLARSRRSSQYSAKRNKSANSVVPQQIYAPRNTFFLFFDSFLLLSFSIQLKVKSIYFPGQEAREPIGCHNASQLKISNRTNSKIQNIQKIHFKIKSAEEEEDMPFCKRATQCEKSNNRGTTIG